MEKLVTSIRSFKNQNGELYLNLNDLIQSFTVEASENNTEDGKAALINFASSLVKATVSQPNSSN